MGPNQLDVRYVARLARLDLTADEEARFGAQLADVLGYMQQLQEVVVTGVEPTAHPMPLANVSRPDAVGVSLPTGEALKNAPASSGGLFLVPKIVE
jgi:aspartyl-tRNA(Asn)/glutamyl-tRNA(Gln) amidotransferase subunit C